MDCNPCVVTWPCQFFTFWCKSFISWFYLSIILTCSYGFQVDAVALQYQNQKLVQQLEAQKGEMLALEKKFKELRDVQSSYDLAMISLNKMWNQVLRRGSLHVFAVPDATN